MAVHLSPTEAIGQVLTPLTALPACVAGSAVASETYGLDLSDSSDVDVFCYTEQALIAGIERLLHAGFTLDDRFGRVWERWLRYGLRGWHTNSMKLHSPAGLETNLVYKLVGKHPLTSLSQVLESFDFGLLAVGYDLLTDSKHDMREYLFPGMNVDGPLPMMPNKRDAWINGFISRYNGLRESGRYAKYVSYGHDLSLVKDDMVTGYWAAAAYLRDRGDAERIQLAEIYETIALKMESDEIDELLAAGKQLPYLDSLDQIMEALE